MNKYTKMKEQILLKSAKILFTVLLFLIAIILGMTGGNILSESKINLVKKIDPESFKHSLNQSMPLIDTIYNSGNLNTSVFGEINNLLHQIFSFDLSNPLTIMNSQSPLLVRYYMQDYRQKLAKKDEPAPPAEIAEIPGETTPNPTTDPPADTAPKFKEDASSISTDEGSEDQYFSDNKTVSDGKISIYNQTKFKVDVNALLKEPLKIKFDRKGPKILVYHTHTSESYLEGWTSDGHNGVVRVGEEIANILRKKYDMDVIHNATINDYDYNNSYHNAYKTVSQILKGNPSLRLVLDVHRDGLAKGSQKLRVVKQIGGKNVAQVMFVMGSSESGLSHPNWKENLKLALRLQEKLNSFAPGLAKPIHLSTKRYNQHVSNGAMIIEVGGDGNTTAECVEAAKYLARAINEVIKDMK